MTSFEELRAQTIGQGYDIDGAFGNQCWDFYAQYSRLLGYPVFSCSNTGYVRDIWELRRSSGILNYFTEYPRSACQKGDVIVFRESASCPYSHIGVVASAPSNGNVLVLGQNQPYAYVTEVWLPLSDAYETVFRPKVFDEPEEGVPVNNKGLRYQAHTQDIGWRSWVHDGQIAGTVGQSRQLEALRIDTSAIEGLHLDVKAHIQDVGWVRYPDISDTTTIGTVGQSRRLEAIELEFAESNTYEGKLKYQVHLANTGWTGRTDVGFPTGTSGLSKAIEAIKIWLE